MHDQERGRNARYMALNSLGEIDATGQGWGIAVGNNHGSSCRTTGQGLIGARDLVATTRMIYYLIVEMPCQAHLSKIGTHPLPDPPIIAGITLIKIIGQQKLKIFTA